jgi:SAM-dependent methyltransferase
MPFDEDYFLRGKATGKSLYEDYRWLPDLTIPMAQALVDYVGICKTDTILDFGCARGYLVKALRRRGYEAWGIDCSAWAIENCDKEVVGLVRQALLPDRAYDWIIAKDVLEHIPTLGPVVADFLGAARKGVFVVIPLSAFRDGKYVVREYEADITHVHRLPLWDWAAMFMRPGWTVEACYRVKGIKDNYWKPEWQKGNGFITARRDPCP